MGKEKEVYRQRDSRERRQGKPKREVKLKPVSTKSRMVSAIAFPAVVAHIPVLLLVMAPPDPRTLAEPVDITTKLPSSLKGGLNSSKWKERKEVLDELLALVNATPRIKDAPEFGDLARSLGVCIQKDANINCVIVAAACIEGLAKGVMTPFGRYRESVVGPMLERLKERKANVTDSIGAALDAMFCTVTHLTFMLICKPNVNSSIYICRPLYPTLSLIFLQPLSIKTLKLKKAH
jgi:hypothetical protein